MSVQNRLTWEAKGSPFRLMTPAADLMRTLRGYGYTVYALGDKRHLEANPPEDHTPYSATGYPSKAQYGVGYAIDIMPPAKAGLPSLQQLGAQLLADRRAGVDGVDWLKYMNWEPGGGPCYHESWQPSYRRTSSTDRGHIHLSGLTGYETSTIGAGYDPVARIRGDDEMLTPAQDAALSIAWQAADALLDLQETTDGGKRQARFVTEFLQLRQDVAALVAQPPGTVTITDEQFERVLRKVLGMAPTAPGS